MTEICDSGDEYEDNGAGEPGYEKCSEPATKRWERAKLCARHYKEAVEHLGLPSAGPREPTKEGM
jgi:hypothetical protein